MMALLQSTTYQGLPSLLFSNVVMARKWHRVIPRRHLPTEQLSAVCGGMLAWWAWFVGQVAEERIPQAAIASRTNGNVRSWRQPF
jgi:hypothetical protein